LILYKGGPKLTGEDYYREAEKFYAEDNYTEALNLFKKSYSIKETNDCLNYIGCCYMNLGDSLSAIRIFKELIKTCPDWERPFFNLGRAYIKLKKYKKAFRVFE